MPPLHFYCTEVRRLPYSFGTPRRRKKKQNKNKRHLLPSGSCVYVVEWRRFPPTPCLISFHLCRLLYRFLFPLQLLFFWVVYFPSGFTTGLLPKVYADPSPHSSHTLLVQTQQVIVPLNHREWELEMRQPSRKCRLIYLPKRSCNHWTERFVNIRRRDDQIQTATGRFSFELANRASSQTSTGVQDLIKEMHTNGREEFRMTCVRERQKWQ